MRDSHALSLVAPSLTLRTWVGWCAQFALSGRDNEVRRIAVSEPKELGELREEKGLSVEELAEQSRVDADIIRAIERGRWYQESEGFLPIEKKAKYCIV